MQIKELIKKIKEKRELSGLSDSIVKEHLDSKLKKYNLPQNLSELDEKIIVKEKQLQKYKDGTEKYLVSARDGQVFQITDTILKWRWDSSNLYAYLQSDMECSVTTQGWRFPLFSDYKNILEASCNVQTN